MLPLRLEVLVATFISTRIRVAREVTCVSARAIYQTTWRTVFLRIFFETNLLEREVISRTDCNANSDRNSELRNTDFIA